MVEKSSGGIWSRYFIQIMMTNVAAQLSVQMLNTTIVPYAMWLGTAASFAGVISGVNFMCSLVSRPFSGLLTNLLDKRRLLLGAILIFLVSSAALAAFSSLAAVLVFRAFQGVGYAFITTLCMAIVADLLPPERIGQGIGYFGLSQCVAQMAGPAIGLRVSALFGYHAAYVLVTALFALALVCAMFLPPIPAKMKTGFDRSLLAPKNLIARESLLPTTVGLLFSILNSCLSAFLSVYAASRGYTGAGAFFAVSAVTMFAARLLGAKTADRRSLAFTGAVSGLLLIAAMLMLGFGASEYMMWAAGAVFGVGYGFLLPVTQSRSVSAPPPERHGTGSSTYFIGIDLGFSIGNVAGGVLVQHLGAANMYLCLIVPAAAAIALCLAKGRDR
jgi:predicted MFS family arabinose efflux permease